MENTSFMSDSIGEGTVVRDFNMSLLDPDIVLDNARVRRRNIALKIYSEKFGAYIESLHAFTTAQSQLCKAIKNLSLEYDFGQEERDKLVKDILASKIGGDKTLGLGLFKPRGRMSKEDQELDQKLYSFFIRFSRQFERCSEDRKILFSTIKTELNKEIKKMDGMEQGMENQFKHYQNAIFVFNKFLKDIKKARDNYNKGNEKISKKSKKTERDKKKLDELRNNYEKKVEEYENVEKMVAFIEEQTRHEIKLQRDSQEGEFVKVYSKHINNLKKFFSKCADNLRNLESEIGVTRILNTYHPLERRKVLHIMYPRPVFKFRSRTKITCIPVAQVMERPHEDMEIPKSIMLCISFIREHLDIVGIFRKSGKKLVVDELVDTMDEGDLLKLEKYWVKDHIHTCTSAFKEYLRKLPASFLPWAKFAKFPTLKSIQEKSDFLKKIVDGMNPYSRMLLYHTFSLMKDVDEHSGKNLMTAENLGNVVSINMFKAGNLMSKKDPRALMMFQKMTQEMKAVFLHFILEFVYIFPRKPKVPKIEKVPGIHASNAELKKLEEKFFPKKKMKNFSVLEILKKQPLPLSEMVWKNGIEPEKVVKPKFNEEIAKEVKLSLMEKEKAKQIEGEPKPSIQMDDILFSKKINDTTVLFALRGAMMATYKIKQIVKTRTPFGICDQPDNVFDHSNGKINSEITNALLFEDDELYMNSLIISASTDKTLRGFRLGKDFDEGHSIEWKSEKLLKLDGAISLMERIPMTQYFAVTIGKKILMLSTTDINSIFFFHDEHFERITSLVESFSSIFSYSEIDGMLCEWRIPSKRAVRIYELDSKILSVFPVADMNSTIASLKNGALIKWNRSKISKSYVLKIPEIEKIDSQTPYKCAFQWSSQKDLYVTLFQKRKIGIFSGINGIIDIHEMAQDIHGMQKIDDEKFLFYCEKKVYIMDEKFILGSYKVSEKILGIEQNKIDNKELRGLTVFCEGGLVYFFNYGRIQRTIREVLDEEQWEVKAQQRLFKQQNEETYEQKLEKLKKQMENEEKKVVYVDRVSESGRRKLRRNTEPELSMKQKLEIAKRERLKKDSVLTDDEKKRRREERRRKRREERLKRNEKK